MNYRNVIFWNVSEMLKDEETGAYALLRLPLECESGMTEQGRNMNRTAIGVELRFRIRGEVTFRFLSKNKEGTRAYLYHGSVQAGWEQTCFTIMREVKEITVADRYVSDPVREINQRKGSPFSSEIFRLIFDATEVQFVDMKGDCLPLFEDDTPSVRYLAYGSSITAGSLTYLPQLAYPALVAGAMKCDLINLGFPGSCRMEKEIADHLAERNDFDIATIELGINVIAEWTVNEFQEKVRCFLRRVIPHHPQVRFYITDLFPYFNRSCGTGDEKVRDYQKVVADEVAALNAPNVRLIRASDLLSSRTNLTADLVHPDLDGHREIAENLIRFMKR